MKFYRPEKYHDECFGTLFLYGQATSVNYISCSIYWKELYTLHNSISIGFSLHLLLLDNKFLVDSSDLFLKSTGSKPHTFGRTMKIFVDVILIRIVWNIKHIRLVMKDNYQRDKISIKIPLYIYCLGLSTYPYFQPYTLGEKEKYPMYWIKIFVCFTITSCDHFFL